MLDFAQATGGMNDRHNRALWPAGDLQPRVKLVGERLNDAGAQAGGQVSTVSGGTPDAIIGNREAKARKRPG
jgi:hypothetical protein